MASIRLDGVSVVFPIYNAGSRSLKNRVLAASTGGRIGVDARNNACVQALHDVCLSIEHGARVGLVGHNGAGKTTLLRVLAGIYEPLAGRVTIRGQVAPLFDISLGMDPDSTGYENIVLRGLFLGLSRAQIRAKRDEIAVFTELGPFLDMPLRTYSAGMQARLAFAVSTSIEPEILLVDEGIGGADAAFIDKATRRLDDLIRRAGILVVASHAEALIQRLCTTVVLMEHGQVVASGPTGEILARYRNAA